jgi:hypothetical protein
MVRSPEQQYALAKSLPISELAKVLQGQSDVVDMWVAESTLRQKTQAQKAKQGMMAQQMAQSPKIVEKDLMEAQQVMQPRVQPQIQPNMEQGIAALPVGGIGEIGNMNGAGGGIVAFDDGGPVEHYQEGGPTLLQSEYDSLQNELRNYGFMQQKADPQKYNAIKQRLEALRPQLEKERASKFIAANPMGAGVSASLINRFLPTTANVSPAIEPVVKTAAAPAAIPAGPPVSDVYPDESRRGSATFTSPFGSNLPGGRYEPKPKEEEAKKDTGIAALPTVMSFNTAMTQARNLVAQTMGTAPTVLDDRAAVNREKQILTQAGFDFNLYKDQMKELADEKAKSKEDRKEAINFRLLEAGLGIMGGESPYAFVNIGKGATPALKGLQEDIKDIKKVDRERDKAIRDLKVAENQVAAGLGAKASERVANAEKRLDDHNQNRARIEANIFSTITSSDTQRYVANVGLAATRESKDETRKQDIKKIALQQADEAIKERLKANPTMSAAEMERERTRFYLRNLEMLEKGAGVGQGVPSGTVKYDIKGNRIN